MPMAHLLQIGAKNRYQKTATGFSRILHAIWYLIFLVLVSSNAQDTLYFRAGFTVPVFWCEFGADFWCVY